MVSVESVTFQVLLFRFVLFTFGVDHDIVHVYRKPPLSDLGTEDSVHHHLEGGGRVCESEEHYRWFE